MPSLCSALTEEDWWPRSSARGQGAGLRTDVPALGKEPTSLLLSTKVASQDIHWPVVLPARGGHMVARTEQIHHGGISAFASMRLTVTVISQTRCGLGGREGRGGRRVPDDLR